MMEIDPVCGMEVDPKMATNMSNYQGKTYYFCTEDDKRAFDKEPQRYVHSTMQSGEHMHH
jgi:YHS domain-containing protein